MIKFVVIGATSGDAFAYCHRRWLGAEAVKVAVAPVSAFALRQHDIRDALALLLPGHDKRSDWPGMDAALTHGGVETRVLVETPGPGAPEVATEVVVDPAAVPASLKQLQNADRVALQRLADSLEAGAVIVDVPPTVRMLRRVALRWL